MTYQLLFAAVYNANKFLIQHNTHLKYRTIAI